MNAIVAERGQVTIPKKLREALGIRAKTVLAFHAENGRLIAVKAPTVDGVAKVRGCLKLSRSTDELVAEMRGDA